MANWVDETQRDQGLFHKLRGETLTENSGRTSMPWYGLKLAS